MNLFLKTLKVFQNVRVVYNDLIAHYFSNDIINGIIVSRYG